MLWTSLFFMEQDVGYLQISLSFSGLASIRRLF